MSSYWKKKLDELNEQNAKSTSVTPKATKTTKSNDYWGNKLTELENANKKKKEDEDEIAPVLSTPKKEKDEGGANLWDLTWKSLERGFYNSRYGEESYAAMMGEDNEKDKYARMLAEDEYQFTPNGKIQQGVSGAFELLGQQVRQFTNPSSVILAGGMAGAAAVAGQAGPQVLLPEEVITVPGAFATGLTMGSTKANLQIEAGLAYNEMVEAGISEETAKKVALGVGGVNASLEMLQVDELVKAFKVTKAAGTTKNFSQKILDELVERGVDIAKETAQEVAQEGVTIAGTQMASKHEKGEWAYTTEDVAGRLADTAVSSALSFGMMNVPAGVSNISNIATEQKKKTALTDNEQKVIDKEYENRIAEQEQDGRKLTKQEKSKIYDTVVSDMEKGYISTDTIEEVLGGDTYKSYKDTIDSEDALQNEFDTLNKMKQGDMTGEQIDRRAELKEQLAEIKNADKRSQMQSQLRDEVFGLVKGDRLVESYNERTRRGQAFEADLTKYDAKQQTVIQKAVESGILNNTNRTHEFVDMIAKISADKGVLFDFTNNEKLKGTSFAVDGKTVNGFVNENGVTLNIDSAKSLNSVVGHEITHVLEGTDLYDVLQKTIVDYAKSKGDYQGRYDTISRLYADQKGANIDAELTADLVGDYLFTDSDFIHNLSTNHRNVFQKIYDEIKYLCKVATAGSKEARELEKAKRAFEKAYQSERKSQEDANTQYSISDSDGNPIDSARISDNEIDTKYSLSHNPEIAKGQSDYVLNKKSYITAEELEKAQEVTNAMVDVMMKYSSILPEDKIGKVLTKNGSYDRSVENTTICVRTLAYNEFVDKVQEEIGRPLTQMESFLVSQKLYDIAVEPQCLYCYVSLDRKAFNDMLLRYMQDRDTVIAKYNNSDKSPAAIDALYEEFLHGRKPTKEMKSRFDAWISYVDNGTQLLSLADIATEDRQSVIKANGGNLAAQLADARKYAQSASWSKIQKNYVAYRDEILKLGDRVVKNLNEHYGLRWYSFSDYSAAFIVENMQQITDASIRGLKGLAYTKDTDFAEIFAPSGMNINVSVFVNQDKDGNFFIDEKQSANFEKALELRERYPNVGIVATVTNDDALRWAGSQEWSDVIIPFHIVRTGTDVAEYYKWLNYTAESADTIKDKDIWNSYLDSLNLKNDNARKKVSKNIYPNEHKNDKATYLNLCESRGLSPRFVRFAGEDWYMKLVNETRLSADASSPLKPVYNEDAAKQSFQKFVNKGGYEGGWYNEGVDVDAEARAVADDVLAGKKANEVNYGRQDGFNPESLIANRKTNRTHGRYSLGDGNDRRTFGNYNVYGEDIALETEPTVSKTESVQEAAPVTTSKMETTTEDSTVVESMFPDDLAPMSEDDSEQFDSLTDEDMPPEMEAPYYEDNEPAPVDDPFENRYMDEVGNPKVKAYMYENPEVKPFFQQEAAIMLRELQDSTKGQKLYNDRLYYDTNGEQGWFGQTRNTSEQIAYLLDGGWGGKGYTYAEIEKGLKAIIEDNGKENNACSKRIEFLLNDRLKDGYTDFRDGSEIPPDEGYLSLMEEKQITEYSKEAFDALVEDGDEYAPSVQYDIESNDPAPTPEALLPDENEVGGTTRQNAKGQQKLFPESEESKPPVQQEMWPDKTAKILTEEPPKNKNQRGLWSMFKEYVLDNGMVFEDLSLKTGNRELQAKWHYIRNARAMAQSFMGNGKNGARALNDLRQMVESSGKMQSFSEYAYHLLNVDRMTLAQRYEGMENKPVFGNHVTAEQSAQKAVQLERANPEFKRWAKELYTINTQLREMLVEGGVLSRETADLWAEMYPHYIPIRRAGYEGAAINVALDTNRTGVNAPIKKATGGNRDILPMFDTMGQRTLQTYRAIAKNRFGLELRKTLGTTVSEDAAGLDSVIDSMDNEETLLTKGDKNNAPTFTVFENGKRYTFEITDEMYESMKPTSDLLAYTNPVLNTASNAFRGLLTEYNPVFMTSNAIKDAQDVLINSQHPARTYMAMPKAIGEMMSGGNYYREYMENGGEENTYFDGQENTFDTKEKGAKKLLGIPPLSWISKANNVIERLPRMAEYIASREDGRSIEVSMLDAARVTTNFAAGGKLTKFANRNGVTFLNASVQGAVQQARNIREAKANGLRGAVYLAAKVAVAGLPAMLVNHLLWDDDEDYEELSDYVKQDYYIVGKTGDGQFIRIPKGRTLAVIQNAFEQMENLVTGDDEVDLKAFLDLAVANLAPNNPIENNILAPIKQVAENKTWYGEDLVPTRLADLPKAEQFDESTDSLSKWLGEKQPFLSPYQINYLLDQYSGGVGDVFLPMLTPEAESGDNSLAGNFLAPLKKKFTTDAVMNNQNVSDFYDTKDELATNAKRRGATDEDVLKSKYFNSINSELSDLYAQKREIQNSTLPDDAKYNAVRDIQSQIVELTKEALNDYPNVSISGNYAEIGNRQYRKNDTGEWTKLSDKQTEKQDEVTDSLDISASEYWRNKEEYDFAYEKPEKYAVAKSVGGYTAYKDYTKQLYDIKGEDLNGDGRSDSGTRKEKVLDWINNLDADYGTKIILFKNEYNADDTYNYEIIEYLNSRSDISGEEMETILKELGFEVDSKGNISW